MSSSKVLGKRKRAPATHKYLTGNFGAIQETCPLTPCSYSGNIPAALAGGQYVRNGSNPVSNQDLGRDAHWFDGDGMLSGVLFKRTEQAGEIIVQPEFVNQYILTDVYLSAISTPGLKRPILPSISTLIDPLCSLFRVLASIFRAIFLVLLSRLPGSQKTIKKISVANTSVMYHDGRALATCESGPPLRISLPTLDTVGWFDGNRAEGEPSNSDQGETLGGSGIMAFMKEWTTAHPKVDPETGEMLLFHSNFAPPFVHYSIIPATKELPVSGATPSRLMNRAVPGISSAKMMHDFGVSKQHTVIMDLPLSLDPLNLLKNKPPIMYDSSKPSRFGIFPRRNPSGVRWFETAPCCIFHTVNTWDVFDSSAKLESVDMLVCRMTSASVVFNAGNIAAPQPTDRTVKDVFNSMAKRGSAPYIYEKDSSHRFDDPELQPLLHETLDRHRTYSGIDLPYEDDQCRLYYYSFPMGPETSDQAVKQYALSAIPFEFPSVRPGLEMLQSQFVYGCTTTEGTFNSALESHSKIDALVKFDIQSLLARARCNPPPSITGCVDARSVNELLKTPRLNDGAIQIFQVPPNHYAQEPRFVPSNNSSTEDDGFLLAYVFDENQLQPNGQPPPSATSELWVIEAKGMKDVLAKVHLPQRVPYGLHGNWFSEQQVLGQRPVEHIRKIAAEDEEQDTRMQRMGRTVINGLVRVIGG